MSALDKMLPDAEARRRIAEDLDTTLFVEAAAGTGKTTALVSRVVALIRSGSSTLDRIVAVTFTEKAAGEMKLRLRAEIETARGSDTTPADERARLDNALSQLELARIGTIHAFCGDLLRERPVEAGVDPLFEVAAEDQAEGLLDTAFDSWFEEALADPPAGVRRVLRRRPQGPYAQGPREALRSAVWHLQEHRDFPASWQRDAFDRNTAIDAMLERLAQIGALATRASWSEDYLARNLAEVQRFLEETRHLEAVRGRDHDGLEAELRNLARARSWRWKGGRRAFAADLPRNQVLARRDAVKAELDELLAACDADLAPLLREELRPVIEHYEILKQRAGKLDFLDLLVRARDLIRDDGSVRGDLQERFTHYFVDEFQDTDPLQAEILLLLAANDPAQSDWTAVHAVPGKLFLVGDPKQSIYRFRRADVAIYEHTKRTLASRGAEVIHLTTSFRGLPSLQALVNAAFEPVMRGSPHGSQAEYVPLEPFREELRDRPTAVALPVPRPYGDYRTIVAWRIDQSLPDAVGAFVDWLVTDSGWTVNERDIPEPVPIQPRHVCILFRRLKSFWTDVSRPYVRALEARRVPHVLVGGRSFHDREEILALRNALTAIEWPDDELRVYATLRGPFFAFGDDALLAFKHRVGKWQPLRRYDLDELEGSDREVADALTDLGELHRRRNHRPIAETLQRFLDQVRAHAGIAIWPTGEQALANCLRMIDLARRFEHGGARSFRAFVERMEEQAETGEAEDAPVVEEGTEGVRIMTVHRAKGLEFPVVILADPTCKSVRDQPSRHVDTERGLWAEPLCGCAPKDLLEAKDEELRRDAEESVRLTYVAATRARDLLVVPVVGDEPIEGWLEVLDPVIYPSPELKRDSAPATNCPDFGLDSVYERPGNVDRDASGSVRPGLHSPQAGTHDIVWWDPAALDLDREEQVGLRQQAILVADEKGAVAEEGERAHEAWQKARHEAIEAGSKPTLLVRSVTKLAGDAAEQIAEGERPALTVAEVPLDRSRRPGGKRFGTLVHAVLENIDLGAGEEAVRKMAMARGRLIAATDEEIDASAVAVSAALQHPLLRSAAQSAESGGLRREAPVMLRLADGTLAEGFIDLSFREDDGTWNIVDFKTDRELETHRARYEEQVRLYMQAVASATGAGTKGFLLVV